MAYYVAKVLHIRPNEILDQWGAAELLVAFGEYANEESAKHYEEWKQQDPSARAKTERPDRYAVYFRHGDEIEWQQSLLE